MLKVYGFDLSTRSNKVLMCLNALDIEHEYIRFNVREGEHKSESYMEIHPAGKIPAIDDDGFIVFESNAIIKYLCRKVDSEFYPQDPQKQAIIDQWCDFIAIHLDTKFISVLYNKIIAPQIGLEVDQHALNENMGFIGFFLPIIEDQLNKTKFIAGDDFTIADISLLSVIDPSEMLDINLGLCPSVQNWREELRSYGFYQQVHKYFGECLLKESHTNWIQNIIGKRWG